MTDIFSKDFEFFEKSLNLRQKRQEILASNIANSDTPNYKARDIDFSKSLRQAMGNNPLAVKRLPDTSLSLTSNRHIPAKAQSAFQVKELYRSPTQPSIDGNTVDMNIERVQFADNTANYQAELQVVNTRLRQLLSAIQQ